MWPPVEIQLNRWRRACSHERGLPAPLQLEGTGLLGIQAPGCGRVSVRCSKPQFVVISYSSYRKVTPTSSSTKMEKIQAPPIMLLAHPTSCLFIIILPFRMLV